jgi:hypothetical protein
MLLRNEAGDQIINCILDRDYHTPSEVDARYKEAAAKNVALHVWAKKDRDIEMGSRALRRFH